MQLGIAARIVGAPLLPLVLMALLVAAPRGSLAQDVPCERPSFAGNRAEENWGALADPACRGGPWDGVKYLPVADGSFLSLGLDLRERYEYVRNPDWGRGPPDPDGFLLHRLMLHGDWRWGQHFRTFVQLKSALAGDRNGGPRPLDVDVLDLHQGFVELLLPTEGAGTFALRTGRQEYGYGKARLVAVRETPNVRRSFDGVRAIHRLGMWRTELSVNRLVEVDPGFFDDGWVPGEWFWGVYATGVLVPKTLGLDLYYLGLRRSSAAFEQGTGLEIRHTTGARLWGAHAAMDYDVEGAWQFGRFGSGRIGAWWVAANAGYTFEPLPLAPRIGLKGNVSSGDRDPNDADLQTFNPMYPTGNYFGEAALLGPMNQMDLNPTLSLKLAKSLSLTADWLFFWRQRTEDGLYRINTALQVGAGGSDDRYVGSQGTLQIDYRLSPNLSFTGVYTHFFPGGFLRESGLGRNVDYVGVWAAYRI